MLVELPSDMNGSVKTPVASHLYNMDKDSVKLPEETAHLFHHLISNLLYFSHRTRQDIQTVVYSYVQGYNHQMWMTIKNWLE